MIVLFVFVALIWNGCKPSSPNRVEQGQYLPEVLTPPNESSQVSQGPKRVPRQQKTVQDSLLDAITYVEDAELIRALIKRGADVNQKDEYSFYPLYWAQYQNQFKRPEDIDSTVIKTLLELGAVDYNARVSNLFELCEKGNLDSIKILIGEDLGINSKRIWYDPPEEDASCYCYETPISASVKSGNLALVQYFIDQGAIINLDRNGVQPLSIALKERQYAIANLLLQHKAKKKITFSLDDPFYTFWPDDTVYLDYLIKNEFPYETPYGGVDSPLQVAARAGNPSTLKRLISIASKDDLNRALCVTTSKWVAEQLLANGADVNCSSSFFGEGGCQYFRTPLSTAAETGDVAYAKMLIDNGADVNFLDAYMIEYATVEPFNRCNVLSPLIVAVINNNLDVAKFLISKGANVNYILQEKWEEKHISPLIAAVQKNNIEITKLLLSNGAKVINNTVSIMDYVTNATSLEIVEVLNKAK